MENSKKVNNCLAYKLSYPTALFLHFGENCWFLSVSDKHSVSAPTLLSFFRIHYVF